MGQIHRGDTLRDEGQVKKAEIGVILPRNTKVAPGS